MNIGLTTRLDKSGRTSELRASIDVGWMDFLYPVASSISLIQTFDDNLNSLSTNLDLVIFTGGNDLSTVCDSKLSVRRDKSELQLLSNCLRLGIPVLGVCRGMQLIHTYFGGKLQQVEHHVRTEHQLISDCNWLGGIKVVNSYHNWGLVSDSLSSDFTISAVAGDDGKIEAFHHKEFPVRGVMWHPERWNKSLGNLDIYRQNQRKILEFNL